MRNVTTYNKLTTEEMRDELVVVTSALAAEYEQLGVMLADQHRDFLEDYARSPGGSVAAKNRDAQYANQEVTKQIIIARAKVNSFTLCRDLLVFLLLSNEPGTVPFPVVADFDDDGLVNA